MVLLELSAEPITGSVVMTKIIWNTIVTLCPDVSNEV